MKSRLKLCISRRLLSEAAAQLSDTDVAAMEAAAAGYPVHLTDVQPGLDVRSFFSRWGDDVTAVQQASGSDTGALSAGPPLDGSCLARNKQSLVLYLLHTAVVQFSREAARQDALAQLGGGIRGKFRVVRARPRLAAAAAAPTIDVPATQTTLASNTTDGAQPQTNGLAAASHGGWQTVAPRTRPQGAFVPPHRRLADSVEG